MNKASVLAFVAFSLAIASGCSSSVTTGTGGSGGNGGGSGGNGGNGGTGGVGGALCQGYGDETGAGTVTFHIRNQTFQPVYLNGNCGSTPQYTLSQIGAGEDATSWVYETGCLQTCADLQTESPYACDVCAPSVLRLDPGQSLDVTWSGTGVRGGYDMPAACYAFQGGFDTCSRIVAAPAGMWSAVTTGYSDCPADTCMCQPDGTCWGQPSGLMAYATPAKFSYPSETSVDIVFDSCAFGCP